MTEPTNSLETRGQMPAILSMVTGTSLWLGHYLTGIVLGPGPGFLGTPLPVPLLSMLCGLVAYLTTHFLSDDPNRQKAS